MAVIHSGLRQGRYRLGFETFRQQQFQALRPSKYSCFVFCHCPPLPTRDIHRTLWSSRPDTVFLLESWGLLTDLARSKLHMAPDFVEVDDRRCWLRRKHYCEDGDVRRWRPHIPRRGLIPWHTDVHRRNFPTAVLCADTGSRCRLRLCSCAALLCILWTTIMHKYLKHHLEGNAI